MGKEDYKNEKKGHGFLCVPKELLFDNRYKQLTIEAILLYAYMLDRLKLSIENGWKDSDGKVFIYFSLESIMDLLKCSKGKAISTLKELDTRLEYFSEDVAADKNRKEFDIKNHTLCYTNQRPDFLFIGDSITEYWELNAYFRNSDQLIINRGIAGDTTKYLKKRFYVDQVLRNIQKLYLQNIRMMQEC